jgi:hypothetical protein
MIGNLRKQDFKRVVRNNMINNCPVTPTTTTSARTIFGPDLASVRGKTVHVTPAPVVADSIAVPRSIIERNEIVTIAVDVFFVDGIVFLLGVSRHIKFITVEQLVTRTPKSLSKHLQHVHQVYLHAGFNVRTILMDGEFEKMKDKLSALVRNTTATKEHMSKTKHSI